jgi:hypothetical protein
LFAPRFGKLSPETRIPPLSGRVRFGCFLPLADLLDVRFCFAIVKRSKLGTGAKKESDPTSLMELNACA